MLGGRDPVTARQESAEPQPRSASRRLERGEDVAGYRIRRELDRPAGAYVAYDASRGSRGDRVVLKLIDSRLGEQERFVERLRHDLPLQAALDHPHMVRVLDGGRAEQGLYVVSALVRRPTLATVLGEEATDSEPGRFTPSRALRMLAPIAELLDVAHARGLVHGCLHTRCVRLGPRDQAYVDDFGLSGLDAAGTSHAGPTLLPGAPEQFAGRPATPRSDVYSLAALAYECLTGEPPYWQGPLIQDGSLPRVVPRRAAGLPPELDAPMRRALSREPEERPASPGQLLTELVDVLAVPSEGPRRGGDALPGDGGGNARRKRPRSEPTKLEPPPVTVWNVQPTHPPARGPASSTARVRRSQTSEPPAAVAAPPGVASVKSAAAADHPRRGVRRLGLLAAVAALAALAALAGYELVGSDPAPPPKGPRIVRSAAVELTAPVGWRRVAAPDVAGLRFTREPIALTDSAGPRAVSLVAGSVVADAPTFLPEPVVAGLTGGLPRPDVVALRGVRALRYAGLRAGGSDRLMTLYAAPTSEGVATISCATRVTRATARQLDRCEQVAATLRLRGAQPVELLFSAQYGTVLSAVLRRLNSVRARERLRLRERGRQPEAARVLALAYAAAGRTLARTTPPPAARMHEALRRAFRRTRQAYAGLSAAARQNDRVAYRRARQSVVDGERDIRLALDDLNALGYAAR